MDDNEGHVAGREGIAKDGADDLVISMNEQEFTHKCTEGESFFHFSIGSEPKVILVEAMPSIANADFEVAMMTIEKEHLENAEKDKLNSLFESDDVETWYGQACPANPQSGLNRIQIMPYNDRYLLDADYLVRVKITQSKDKEVASVDLDLKLIDTDPIIELTSGKAMERLIFGSDVMILHYELKDRKKSYLLLELSDDFAFDIFLSSKENDTNGNVLSGVVAMTDCKLKHFKDLNTKFLEYVSPYEIAYPDGSGDSPAFGSAQLQFTGKFKKLNTVDREGTQHMSACDEYWVEMLEEQHRDGCKYVLSTQFYEFLGHDAYIIIKKKDKAVANAEE